MKSIKLKFLICFFIVLPYSFGQTLSLHYEYGDLKVSLKKPDSIYTSQDTLIVDVIIENFTKTNIFIFEYDENEILSTNVIDCFIFYNYGGHFEPEFDMIYKLKLLQSGQRDSFKVKMTLEQLFLKDPITRFSFLFNFGYFLYNERLEYLTKGAKGWIRTYPEDVSLLIDSHRNFEVGYLSIRIKK